MDRQPRVTEHWSLSFLAQKVGVKTNRKKQPEGKERGQRLCRKKMAYLQKKNKQNHLEHPQREIRDKRASLKQKQDARKGTPGELLEVKNESRKF